MKKLGFFLMIPLLLVACGVSDNNDNESNGNEQGDGEVQPLSLEVNFTEKEDVGVFDMHLKNESEEPVQVTFSSGQQYEIVIQDSSSGEQVYKFSEGKMFTQAIIEEEIAAGEELSFEQEWDYTSNGESVEPGEYQATVSLIARSVNGEEVTPDSLTKELSITVPEAPDQTSESPKEEESKNDDAAQSNESEEQTEANSSETNREDHDNIRNIDVQGEQGEYTVTGETNLNSSINYSVEDGHFVLVEETKVEVSNEGEWTAFDIPVQIQASDLPNAGVLTLVFSWEEDGEKQYHSILLDSFNE